MPNPDARNVKQMSDSGYIVAPWKVYLVDTKRWYKMTEDLISGVRHSQQGALLEGLFEAGAKAHDCSAFRTEFTSMPREDIRAAMAYMIDLNSTRH